MNRTAVLAGAVTGLVFGVSAVALAPAVSATVTPATNQVVCGQWKMRGATGAYPAVTFGGPPAGSSVSKHSAKLVKPATGIQPGVEFAAKGLNLPAPAGMTISVTYVPSADASVAAGAVRLFGYTAKNADTLNDAPNWQDMATSPVGGTLSLTVPAGASVGTLGLVYDASTAEQGSVTFSSMKAGSRKVPFVCSPFPKKPIQLPSASASVSPSASVPVSPSASVSPSVSVSASTSAVPSASASVSPSVSVSPVPEVTAEEQTPVSGNLPLTGPGGGAGPIITVAGIGLFLLVGGLGALVLARRRKATFTA